VIVVLRRFAPRVPGVLVAVVGSILAVTLFGVDVHVVGTLPSGLPELSLPSASWAQFGTLAAGALGITLVSLTDTISTATAFAARTGQEVRGSREMLAIGAANVTVAFFSGFPVSTSGSRTAVALQAGARTPSGCCWWPRPGCCATCRSRPSPRWSSRPRCPWPTCPG
jgi:MFS superfamily sulfate permease-like transporter